ncbi:MAG TPA: hypothetical protein VF406_01810 [Thermodesulfobacteriota bacterium]
MRVGCEPAARPGRRCRLATWPLASAAALAAALIVAALVAAPAAADSELADTWRLAPPEPGGLFALLRRPPPVDADLALRYRQQYLSPDAFFEDEPVADRLGRERLAALKEELAYEQGRELADAALDQVLRASPLFVEIARFEEARRLEEFFGRPVDAEEPGDLTPEAPAPPPVPRKVVPRTLPGGVSVRVGVRIGVTRLEPAVQVVREPLRTRVAYSVTRDRLESSLGLPLHDRVRVDLVHTWQTGDGAQAFRLTVNVPY